MSLQQVNLYQEELRKQKVKFSAQMLVQTSSLLLAVLLLLSGFKYWQLKMHEQALVLQQQKQQQAMADLQAVQSELAKRTKDSSLEQQINDRTKELSNKQKVLSILSQDEFGNIKGFVDHVTGLARQRIDGLWLTQLRIASGGSNISLYGSTTTPSLLPKYLQQLSAEKAFSGTEFHSLLMARHEKKNQWLNFSLQNNKVDGAVNK